MAGKILKTGTSTYSSAIEDATNYTSWVLSLFSKYLDGRVLEVGLGHGGYRSFLGNIDYTGIDIDPLCIEKAQATNKTGKYIQADIVQPSLVSKAGSGYDSVLCVNVLEHIKNDDDAIKNMLEVLKPGGYLLILVPSHEVLYNSMDTLAGHCRRYSKNMLLRRLPKKDRVVFFRYINPIGGLGWWLNRFIEYKNLDDSAINKQIIFFDRFILPLSKLVGFFTKKWFGQSLICVVEKK